MNDPINFTQQGDSKMAAPRCKTCKHYTVEVYGWKRQPERTCGRIVHIDNSKGDDPAHVEDAENYSATLHVTDNFGCVLHEPARPPK